ncbi:uncharacterized protein I303_103791 [Kwoniella dejecticola CBS 10117]|uniref:Major facilitator superfamily (MFS) profile domain-containing protein n=1 Tax=Kwoniella dejecticola CBS 10117 TaxID=1296121 RepID=A0A1A6A7Q9_9TREE|nr:uncharacterized protein I303_03809 [Kwoniella dejecticola CBS 10117]OBR86091.1 hypothetical protein I303_03809 [Kwoniella dejecticola CBS 10117]
MSIRSSAHLRNSSTGDYTQSQDEDIAFIPASTPHGSTPARRESPVGQYEVEDSPIGKTTSRCHSPSLPLPIDANDTPPPSVPELSKARQVVIAITLMLLTLMSASGAQALNIGLPAIQKDLGMRDVDLQWISSAYQLTNGCLLLISGRLADVYGRKLLLLIGMFWFALWSLLGGFMQDGVGLVISRAMTGLGAAMAMPSATGIIAHTYTGRARQIAFACYGAGAAVGGALGLIIGGIFVSFVKHTWRSALWFLSGLGFAAAIAAYLVIPWDGSHTEDKSLDWPGAMLVTSGLVLIQYVISAGQSAPYGWKTSYIIVFIILGILLLVGFFLWEKRVIDKGNKPPLMRLQLWTRSNGRLSAVYFIGFAAWLSFCSILYYGTLFFQEVQMTGPIGAMLRFLPSEVGGLVCNVLVGLLIHRIPAQWIVCTGLLSVGLGNMCFALSDKTTNYWVLPFHGMWLSSAGADFVFAPGLIFVSLLSLPDEHSVAGALFQTLLRLGGSMGLAITSVIFESIKTKSYNDGQGDSADESYLKGLKAAFWLSAAVAWLGLLVGLVALNGLGILGNIKQNDGKADNEKKGKDEHNDRGNHRERVESESLSQSQSHTNSMELTERGHTPTKDRDRAGP